MRLLLVSERLTTVAADVLPERVTVQVALVFEFKVPSEQDKELSVGVATSDREAVRETPRKVAVMVALPFVVMTAAVAANVLDN